MPTSFTARRAGARMQARARLSPTAAAASVALTEAQLAGDIVNVRPFSKGGDVRFRVEVEVPANRVQALLDSLAEPSTPAVE